MSRRGPWSLLQFALLGAVLVVGAFELFRPVQLSYDGLWAARIYLAQTIILLASLFGLAWTIFVTTQQRDEAKRQADAAMDQARLATEQARISAEQWAASVDNLKEQHRPVVVCDRAVVDARNTFVLKNVGPGYALNVLLLELVDSETPVPLGSVGAGESKVVPIGLERLLNQETSKREGKGFVLIAEAPLRGPSRWTATINVRMPDAPGRLGEVHHSNASAHDCGGTLEWFLRTESETLRADLAGMSPFMNGDTFANGDGAAPDAPPS